jgi:hypothetical protein
LALRHTAAVFGTPGSIAISPWQEELSSQIPMDPSPPNYSKSISPFYASRLWPFIVSIIPCYRIHSPNSHVASVNRDVNTNLKFNQETEFVPVLGQVATQLNLPANPDKKKDQVPDEPKKIPASDIQCNHHPALLSLLSRQFSITPDRIHDFDVYVTPIRSPTALILVLHSVPYTIPSHQFSVV